MNKELEALKGLFPCSHKVCEGICEKCPHEKNYNLIKSALECKEKLEKAFKLIKKFGFDEIKLYMEFDSLSQYIFYQSTGNLKPQITEEEFNLLKEMLEDE